MAGLLTSVLSDAVSRWFWEVLRGEGPQWGLGVRALSLLPLLRVDHHLETQLVPTALSLALLSASFKLKTMGFGMY